MRNRMPYLSVVSMAPALLIGFAASAMPQSTAAPNVSQVLLYSTVGNVTVANSGAAPFTLNGALLGIFSDTKGAVPDITKETGSVITNPTNFTVLASTEQLTQALNANIATALSTIPIASPASGVILKRDSTGAAVPANSSLGPVFTERAETIGKGKFYIGVTHQSFQFGNVDGKSLNGLSLLYGGGQASLIKDEKGRTLNSYPATIDLGMSVGLSQSTAFLSYGVTNRFDVSVGLPMVHSSMSSRAYNAKIYMGPGNGADESLGFRNCWCSGTLTPGAQNAVAPQVGSASFSSTGFGDVLVRAKGIAKESSRGIVALGADLRLPSGDSKNYHGIGTTAVKPFAAFSWFPKALSNKVIFAPHAYVGWQFTGKSALGGALTASTLSTNTSLGVVTYSGAPFISTKNYLPDVFSWTIGTEVAFGPRNTFVFDFLGNQIGLIHGVQSLVQQTLTNQLSPTTNDKISVTGITGGVKSSYGQYNGSFGYKAKVAGNLVLTFNALVRFDSNGLTARFVPLYGLGYSF